ncbi:hypothetical protein ACUOFC_03460, partial [Escherichia sp. TWPC-MK]
AILLNIILPGGYRQENVLPGITSAEDVTGLNHAPKLRQRRLCVVG